MRTIKTKIDTEKIKAQSRVRKTTPIEPPEPPEPLAKATTQYKEPIGPKDRPLRREAQLLRKGASEFGREKGEELRWGRKEARILKQKRQGRPPRVAPPRRISVPRRSRVPVPGGRPRRPWIPSRRAQPPVEFGEPLGSPWSMDFQVMDAMTSGSDMLDAGPGYAGNPLDMLDFGSELMDFGPPRQRRRKRRR